MCSSSMARVGSRSSGWIRGSQDGCFFDVVLLVAEHPGAVVVDDQFAGLRAPVPGADVVAADDQIQPFGVFAQFGLEPLALGDVQRLPADAVDGAVVGDQRNLGGEIGVEGSVGMGKDLFAGQLDAVFDDGLVILGQLPGQFGRKQVGIGAADRRVGLDLQGVFEKAVDQQIVAAAVLDEDHAADAVGQGLQQAPVPLEILFEMPLFRKVDECDADAPRVQARGRHRGPDDWKRGTVGPPYAAFAAGG